jgi:Zn finger protein HypA/HybF involved in hydrogenase expression
MWFAGKIIVCLRDKLNSVAAAPKHIAINTALSPFTHVTEESLRAAFRMLIEKEDFKNVTLNIKKNKAVIKCKRCGAAASISKPIFACPECQSADFDINKGEEFSIESIEID